MTNRALLILALVAGIIVGASLIFLRSSPGAGGAANAGGAVSPAPATPAPTPWARGPKLPTERQVAGAFVPPPTPAQPRALAPWERQIDNVLRGPADESQTAQILINMLPSLPPEGQEEAAEHISNLILDEDYGRVAPLVRNPNLPEEVLDVFVTDLMNRDDAVKLPLLLDIAKIPNHPHHEEALTDLEIFLDEDFGSDWGKWQDATQRYLKEQAAEDAADAADDASMRLRPAPSGAPGVPGR